jgi:hypothetical protein
MIRHPHTHRRLGAIAISLMIVFPTDGLAADLVGGIVAFGLDVNGVETEGVLINDTDDAAVASGARHANIVEVATVMGALCVWPVSFRLMQMMAHQRPGERR